MSLTPCKFFAQGSCRFGNNCRFYHGQQQQPGMFGNRALAPATFQPGGGGFNQTALNLTSKSNQNLDIIVEQVKKDMQEWQSCKIWPYSCYGPVGGKLCIPGFEDLSPEEFRLAFMQYGNNLPPEMVQRSQLLQQLRINYQQPTMDNRNTIERIATAGNVPQSPFGGQTTITPVQQSGLFTGASSGQQPGSIFGGGGGFATQQPAQAKSSIFGGSTFGQTPSANTFGQTPAANTFGQTAAASAFGQTPAVSTFGQTPAASTFGQPGILSNAFQTPAPQAAGIFGAQQTQPQGQSPFGTSFQGTQQSSGVFQASQQQPQPGLFQSQGGTGSFFQPPSTQPQQGSLFQPQPNLLNTTPSQPQVGLFQQPLQLQQQQPVAPAPGLFQAPQLQQPTPAQAGMFAPPPGSIFGGNVSQQQSTAVSSTPSIFGGAAGSTAFPAVGSLAPVVSAAPQKYVYSNEADLSPEEMESFRAPEFTIDSLPTKPPPLSLCT